jgi:tricorn protease
VTAIDLVGLSVADIAARITALPLPSADYRDLASGKAGVIHVVKDEASGRTALEDGGAGDLLRWTLEERKVETLASRVVKYELTADGQKMLLAQAAPGPRVPGGPPKLTFTVAPADKPLKAGDGDALKLDDLEVRVDPAAEWRQMYHEVWRIERAFFYDPHFHGYDTVAAEKALEPYVEGLQARADLNYVFQEMLTGFSIGHLRGRGGAIPEARKVPGGLLGADYEIRDGRYCLKKIYTGGSWSPTVKAPLAQPGLNVAAGDCILAINGAPVSAAVDIQQPLEGTAGHAITVTLGTASGGSRDITVIPVASEATLRNIDWIDTNQKKVAEMSGGKLAYVYLPDTGAGGFTNFNRYYFAQTDKKGAIIDERFNAGGQVADYIIEVLGRKIESYWQGRYGAVEHSPAAGIYGPKVMIANEVSGSGGDAMPWLFKYNKLGPLVGKRTWGGLVGIGPIPVLMDGGSVTSPSVGFFSPSGQWDVENHGVDPDYAVEMDPKAVAAGHDPQLEEAVALALDQLAKAPPPAAPEHPPFPNYGGHGS